MRRIEGVDYDVAVIAVDRAEDEPAAQKLTSRGKTLGFSRVERTRELVRKGWALVTEIGPTGTPTVFMDSLEELILMYHPIDPQELKPMPLPMSVVRRDALRLMEQLYEQSGGSIYDLVSTDAAAKAIGLTDEGAHDQVTTYLHGKGLLKMLASPGNAMLTKEGVAEVERALRLPNEPTANFPAINVIRAETITLGAGAQLMQGAGSLQQVSQQKQIDAASLSQALGTIERLARDLGTADRSQVTALIAAARVEAGKPSPDPGIVKSLLTPVRDIAIKAAAGAATNAAAHAAAPIIVEAVKHLIGG